MRMQPAYLSPRVDIYMPTFEPDPAYLREAIQSVCAQTEQGWHLWIHDDASMADVQAIVEPFLRDPRITFHRSDRRLGIGGNWNACLPLGSAPFVQFLFQDDRWEESYLREALGILETHPAVGLVMSAHRYDCDRTIENSAMYRELEHLRGTIAPGLHEGTVFLTEWLERGLHPNLIGEPSFVLLRRSLTEAVGSFDEDLPQCLDLAYWIRCLLHTHWWHQPKVLGTLGRGRANKMSRAAAESTTDSSASNA